MSSTSCSTSSSSNESLVGDIPIVCYHSSEEIHGSTDDLVHAVLAGNIPRVRHLSEMGFAVSVADSWVVYQACLQGIRMMYALNMNPRSKLNRVMPWQMGDRVFHFLLRTPSDRFLGSKVLAIVYLIQHGAHVLEKDRLGNTALHILAEVPTQDDTDGFGVVKALLDRDDNNFVSESTREACISHVDNRNTPLEAGEGSTALMNAVTHGHVECAQVLLEHGANPHLIGPLYQPPLYHAVIRDFPAVASVLLKFGAVVTKEIEEEIRSSEMAEIIQGYKENQAYSDSSEISGE
ncbi:hypothetical protein FANTH_9527 [Fusarium anthophilum]|uniref:Ankyrin repeat protein n=1 Tax=Fusarium anthophilum TaxID=48485 RepID=A0A8H4Z6J3_9HYPO|nr:hypothetical protein FANTH_9527 [Fusarium anthophilum]